MEDIEQCSSPAHFFYEYFKGCVCYRCNHKQPVTAATKTIKNNGDVPTTITIASPTTTMMDSSAHVMQVDTPSKHHHHHHEVVQQHVQQRSVYCKPVHMDQPLIINNNSGSSSNNHNGKGMLV